MVDGFEKGSRTGLERLADGCLATPAKADCYGPLGSGLVLAAYGGRCAISDCDLADALEAAHVFGYMGEETNVVANGLLLRADLHTLYDLGQITIDPAYMKVVIAPKLKKSAYAYLAGAAVRIPTKLHDRPSHVALEKY